MAKTTSTSKKATKKECFIALYEILTDGTSDLETEILLNFIQHEVELLEKKNSKAKKDSKTTKELKEKILEILSDGEKRTSLEVYTLTAPVFEEISPQKITYELSSLVRENLIEREPKSKEKKGKTAFFIA